ncbi:GMC oxidoreductase-domain-containing protein [Usnea florida]
MKAPLSSALVVLLVVDAKVIYNPEHIHRRNYDYVIVGGGLTGLTVAARLTENPKITVLVIESGFWESDRGADISNLTHYGCVFGTAIDHKFATTSQGSDGRSQVIRSGRGLGGSTLINGGSWTRPAKVQIDAWETIFGNTGWNWNKLLYYMKKAEKVRQPGPKQTDAGEYLNPSCQHGKEGPVQVGSRDTGEKYSPIMRALMDTVKKMKVPTQVDLSCGDPRGVSMLPNSVNTRQERSDAGRTWLSPDIIKRKNLDILVGQWAGKVLINATQKHHPKAYGVEFGLHTSRKYEVYAIYEVLLAAGSSVSPLLLEYSGIGMKEVLDKVKVKQIVDLPVGVNMQDQTTTGIRNTIHVEGQGQGQAAYFATFNETFGDSITQHHHLRLLTSETLSKWAHEVVSRRGFHNVTALLVQYQNQVDQIKNHNVAYSELFLDTYGSINFDVWTLLPFSRGYIHIQNADPYLRKVDNNPQYFTNELDTTAQAAATKLARDLSSAGEMERYWDTELVPGFKKVPEEAGLDEWTTYVKGNYRANWHAIGTASMMSKELGGVVDSNAKVYGVEGLRVIDGSIVPTQISSHVMTVFYGMAEKIAHSVLEDWKAQQCKSIGIHLGKEQILPVL